MIFLKQTRVVDGELRVRAVCDECRDERTVRKSWAVARFKERGTSYLCRSCSSSKNIRIALKAKGVDSLVGTFVYLCKEIRDRDLDDKHHRYIANQIGHAGDDWLIQEARDFVASINKGYEFVDPAIIELATNIEEGNQLALDMSSMEDEMKARAMLELEK